MNNKTIKYILGGGVVVGVLLSLSDISLKHGNWNIGAIVFSLVMAGALIFLIKKGK